ncbi:MAG TPA: arsenate reductase ArsC [Bacteroidales bacterium]|nr:arsenate reductase ArsC [Bacteroidales bacterium]
MRILILCTGNSSRSQMAEGFLESLNNEIEVHSAGTQPAPSVNPYAIRVMREVGIDISHNKTHHVEEFLDEEWDYVITVCGGAKETCPAFIGKVKNRVHIGFDDPAEAKGTDEEVLATFRRVRDEIKVEFQKFYNEHLKS